MRRKIVAIGDLHGDVHRLVRILQRQDILNANGHWKPSACYHDVVLLGDYVDWRGETLEGPQPTWERGCANLMETIMSLAADASQLRQTTANFKSAFNPLIGNHDKLMLDTWRYLKKLPKAVSALEPIYEDVNKVQKAVPVPRTKTPEHVLHTRLVNWWKVGGVATIKSFGGVQRWMQRMDDGLGTFLERGTRLGVVINKRQFSHSVSDDPKYWRPLAELDALPAAERDLAIEETVWGRKLWGIDYKTGMKCPKPEQAVVDKMLAGYKVQGVVVGHSLVQSLYPVRAYESKVINIDLHGNPLSEPWLEDYED